MLTLVWFSRINRGQILEIECALVTIPELPSNVMGENQRGLG